LKITKFGIKNYRNILLWLGKAYFAIWNRLNVYHDSKVRQTDGQTDEQTDGWTDRIILANAAPHYDARSIINLRLT